MVKFNGYEDLSPIWDTKPINNFILQRYGHRQVCIVYLNTELFQNKSLDKEYQ